MKESFLKRVGSALDRLNEHLTDRAQPWQLRHLEEVYNRAREVSDALLASRGKYAEVMGDLRDFDTAHLILASEAHIHGEESEDVHKDLILFKRKIGRVKASLACDERGVAILDDENILKAMRLLADESGKYSRHDRRMKDILRLRRGNCSARSKFIASALKEIFPTAEVHLDLWTYVGKGFGHVFPVVRLPESGTLHSVDVSSESKVQMEEFQDGLLTAVTADYLYMISYVMEVMSDQGRSMEGMPKFALPTGDCEVDNIGEVLKIFQRGDAHRTVNDLKLPGRRRQKIYGGNGAFEMEHEEKFFKEDFSILLTKLLNKYYQHIIFSLFIIIGLTELKLSIFVRSEPMRLVDETRMSVRFVFNNGPPGDEEELEILNTVGESGNEVANEMPDESDLRKKSHGWPTETDIGIEADFLPENYQPSSRADLAFNNLVFEFCLSGNENLGLTREITGKEEYKGMMNRVNGIAEIGRPWIARALIGEPSDRTNPVPPFSPVLRFADKEAGCLIVDFKSPEVDIPDSFSYPLAYSSFFPTMSDHRAMVRYERADNIVLEPVSYATLADDLSYSQNNDFVCDRGRVLVEVEGEKRIFIEWDVSYWGTDKRDLSDFADYFARDMDRLEELNAGGAVWYQCLTGSVGSTLKYEDVDWPTYNR